MRKFWEEVACFDLTEIYTHDPIANRHRIFNLRSFLGESNSWIHLNWINLDYFSDLYRSRRCAMKKRIKKKYELLERIEYLENDLLKFTQDTVDVIEVLADRIKRLERKHKKH